VTPPPSATVSGGAACAGLYTSLPLPPLSGMGMGAICESGWPGGMVSAGGVEALTEFFVNLQVWGTPEQCYEKILDIQRRTGAEAYTAVFSYAGMPYDIAEASTRLFAAEVAPELRKHVPIQDQLIARAGVGTHADAAAFRLPA